MNDPSTAPVVSIIMSVRDGAATIDAAIRSVIYQTLTDWELIVIDDGSRDDSAARAAAFSDARIRIIRHETSKGTSHRLNEATGLARGEFIAFMDSDDVSYPERLEVQVKKLRSDPSIDILASHALVFRRQGEPVGMYSVAQVHEQIAADPYRGFGFPHPTWCGRAAWLRRNPFDESMSRAMDQELLLRTAGSSRFAAIDLILLGYRKERIYFTKNLRGRLCYSRAIWRDAQATHNRRRAAKVIFASFSRFAKDMATVGLGGGEELLKKRVPQLLRPEDIARWQTVWRDVSAANQPAAARQSGSLE